MLTLTSSRLPQFYGLGNGMRMLGMPLPTYLSGPIPYVGLTGLEWAGLIGGLAASFGSIALGRKRRYRKFAKIAAGVGGLVGVVSTMAGAHAIKGAGELIASQATEEYASGGIGIGAGLAMIGASYKGWKRA